MYGHTAVYYKDNIFIYGGKLASSYTPTIAFTKEKKIVPIQCTNSIIAGWRKNHTSFRIGNEMIVYGGEVEGEQTNSIVVLNLDDFVWWSARVKSKQEIPFLVETASAIVISDKRDILGQNESRSGCLNWPPILSDKVIKEQTKYEGIYLFGGRTENFLNDEMYVIQCGGSFLRWINLRTFGKAPVGRINASLNYYAQGNMLILHGGCGIQEEETYSDVWILDLEGSVWMKVEIKGDIPINRHSHLSNIFGNELFIFGGIYENKVAGKEIYKITLNPFLGEASRKTNNREIKIKYKIKPKFISQLVIQMKRKKSEKVDEMKDVMRNVFGVRTQHKLKAKEE